MEIQGGTDYLILPKVFSLKQIVLHWLAKKYWRNFFLTDCNHEERTCMPCKTRQSIAYRKKVLKILLKKSKDLPKLLKKELINAVLCLQRGYNEVFIWERKCQSALPFTILNHLTAGDYHASYFIAPSGHFNDFVWARRFVADGNQHELYRFILACLYGFEQVIVKLWHTMKNNRQLPCEGRLSDILNEYGNLVGIMVYQVENEFNELMAEDDRFYDGFNVCGLNEAVLTGHEYAACFFWKLCSDEEKANFLHDLEQTYDLLILPAENSHAGVVNFVYSLLSTIQKENFISWTIEYDEPPTVLSCLLHSQYYETILNDIFDFSSVISTKMYEYVVFSLSCEMTIFPIPVYEMIFRDLWNHLPQEKRIEVLEIEDSYLILNLATIKAMDILKLVIQPLSHSVKERILLNNWQYGGIDALVEFYHERDYDALLSYLIFFLIDYCPITQKISLRSDASSFIDKFIKNVNFIIWMKSLPDSEELEKIIENLQDSLKVLYLVLDQVEENSSNYKKILDTVILS